MTSLVWFRNDLRMQDHQALAAATAVSGAVRAVYLLCPAQWDAHGVAPVRRWYVLASLQELGDALATRGIPLDILDCGDFAAVPDTLSRYCTAHAVTHLFCTREYPLNELRRDQAVADTLRPLGIALQGFDDGVLVSPRALKTGQGTPYHVFTPYKRRWLQYLDAQPPVLPGAPKPRAAVAFPGAAVIDEALKRLSVPDDLRARWQPGERAARKQLNSFVQNELADYKMQRGFPALRGTSLLSTPNRFFIKLS